MAGYTPEDNGVRRQVGAVAFFLLLAVVVSYLPSPAQQQVASLLRGTVLRPFLATQEFLARVRVRATESARLRAQLDTLVARDVARSHLLEENRRLRGLLSLSGRLGPAWVGASVIRPGTAGSESMFHLDVGSEDGVAVNAPVLSGQGLVGVVREVRRTTSIGMDWTHPDFGAPAMSVDGLTYGLVESRRRDFREDDRLILDGTPFHSDLEPGTRVVTSGLGGVFPRGIPVGVVEEVAEADAGWRKSYWLAPVVQPGSVTHVLVARSGSGPWGRRPADPASTRVDSTASVAGDSARAPAGDLSHAWPADTTGTTEREGGPGGGP